VYEAAIKGGMLKGQNEAEEQGIDTLKMKRWSLSVDPKESPRIDIVRTDKVLPPNTYALSFEWHAPTFLCEIIAQGHKLLIPFEVTLIVTNLQVKGNILVGLVPLHLEDTRISFPECPKIDFDISSTVSVGHIELPFQTAIESIIKQQIQKNIQDQMNEQLVLPHWTSLNAPRENTQLTTFVWSKDQSYFSEADKRAQGMQPLIEVNDLCAQLQRWGQVSSYPLKMEPEHFKKNADLARETLSTIKKTSADLNLALHQANTQRAKLEQMLAAVDYPNGNATKTVEHDTQTPSSGIRNGSSNIFIAQHAA